MAPLPNMVQGEKDRMPHELNFYKFEVWKGQLAIISRTGIVLQGSYGEIPHLLGRNISGGQTQGN